MFAFLFCSSNVLSVFNTCTIRERERNISVRTINQVFLVVVASLFGQLQSTCVNRLSIDKLISRPLSLARFFLSLRNRQNGSISYWPAVRTIPIRSPPIYFLDENARERERQSCQHCLRRPLRIRQIFDLFSSINVPARSQGEFSWCASMGAGDEQLMPIDILRSTHTHITERHARLRRCTPCVCAVPNIASERIKLPLCPWLVILSYKHGEQEERRCVKRERERKL